MLVLSRREGDAIKIGDDIVIYINRIRGGRVSIGLDAPSSVAIKRCELDRQTNSTAEVGLTKELCFGDANFDGPEPIVAC